MNILSNMFASINNIGIFSDEEINQLMERVQWNTLTYNDFVLREGAVCSGIFYLEKGSCRQFYVDDHGNEIITNLYADKEWFFDRQSFFTQTPARNNIQACERVEIAQLSISSIHELIKKSQKYFVLGRYVEDKSQPLILDRSKPPFERQERLITFKRWL